MLRPALALLAPLVLAAPWLPRPASGYPAKAAQAVAFNRDIRPILSDNCFACHGPDAKKRQAGLRLDIPNPAVVPGDVVNSALVRRILKEPSDPLVMPPASAHKALTPEQKRRLLLWIDSGAAYEKHWSFVALPRLASEPPSSLASRREGVIDAFVEARLKEAGITPSPEADRRTLIRRVSLDLTGLPPTMAEVDAFLADKTPDAYTKLVDRLLSSPHYGERMASPWLDLVRYADTVGYHGDQNANAWAYRDWVIDAFNANMPFDRFTREQIAGDLLPSPTEAQRIATCFNRLNMVTREGGAQPEEYLAKYAADRVRTVGMAWLGLTTGCAECHDHKFDPLTQKDFYALAAFFADIKQWGVYADYGYTPNPDLRGVGNDHPFFPELTVESAALKNRIARIRQERARLLSGVSVPDGWAGAFLSAHPDGWETPEGAEFLSHEAKAADVSLTLDPSERRIASVRVELLPEAGSLLRKGAAGETINVSLAVLGADGKRHPVPVRHAVATRFEPIYRDSFALLGVHRGWRVQKNGDVQSALYLPARPLALADGEKLIVSLPGCDAAHVRVSVSPLTPDDPDEAKLSLAPDARAYVLATGSGPFEKIVSLEAEQVACRGGRTPVMVTETFEKPLPVRILPRGNWQDRSGPLVTGATPAFLPGPRTGNRLELARWLTSKENPLTARVFVNRLWRLFFGVGLSASVEDFGAQGEPPSHPELLDFLAADFSRDWDVKRAVRQLVLSRAYRRSSAARPDLKEKDPANRLLAAQNPRRLEAEQVRDNALAIAGLLRPEVGGPPAKPYQPAGYYAQLQFPDRDYVADRNSSQWRRGVYMHVQRTFLHPMLASFDGLSREEAACSRTLANTPQQALTLLNDPSFVEAAKAIAASLGFGSDAEKIGRIYLRTLSRWPTPAEKGSLLAFLTKMRASFATRPGDAKKLLAIGLSPAPPGDPAEAAAWTQVCRAVLNLHETITRY
jgi:hypothetical protein